MEILVAVVALVGSLVGSLGGVAITQYFQLRAQRATHEHQLTLQTLAAQDAKAAERRDCLRKQREQQVAPLKSWLSRFIGLTTDTVLLQRLARLGVMPWDLVSEKIAELFKVSREQPGGRSLLFGLSDPSLMELVQDTIDMGEEVKTAFQQATPQSVTEERFKELYDLLVKLTRQVAKCNLALEDYIVSDEPRGDRDTA